MSADDLFDGDDDWGRLGRRIDGVAVGIVTDNEDEAGLGRVKVRFPWRATDESSDWVRVASPMAGGGRGAFLAPEMDDEVLVAFENGDIHHPYVIGALWNGEDEPPVEKGKQADVRTVRTRSGHEIVFDDADGSERVTVTSAGGRTVTLDDAGNRLTVDDGAGQAITFDGGAGEVSIEASSSLTLSAPSVDISGKTRVTLMADGEVAIGGFPIRLN